MLNSEKTTQRTDPNIILRLEEIKIDRGDMNEEGNNIEAGEVRQERCICEVSKEIYC